MVVEEVVVVVVVFGVWCVVCGGWAGVCGGGGGGGGVGRGGGGGCGGCVRRGWGLRGCESDGFDIAAAMQRGQHFSYALIMWPVSAIGWSADPRSTPRAQVR